MLAEDLYKVKGDGLQYAIKRISSVPKDFLLMSIVIILLIRILDIYLWTVIAAVIASWLVVFGVLNMRNRFVYKAINFLNAVTGPPILFLRKYIPPIGGIDLTPMVLIFGIYLAQGFLFSLLY